MRWHDKLIDELARAARRIGSGIVSSVALTFEGRSGNLWFKSPSGAAVNFKSVFAAAAALVMAMPSLGAAPAPQAPSTFLLFCTASTRNPEALAITPVMTVKPEAIHPGWVDQDPQKIADYEKQSGQVMVVSVYGTDDLPAQFANFTKGKWGNQGQCVASVSFDAIQASYDSAKANSHYPIDKISLRDWRPDHAAWVVSVREVAN